MAGVLTDARRSLTAALMCVPGVSAAEHLLVCPRAVPVPPTEKVHAGPLSVVLIGLFVVVELYELFIYFGY